jgi:hypothetical protein
MKLLSISKLLECKRVSIKRMFYHINHYFSNIDIRILPHNIIFLKKIFLNRIIKLQNFVRQKIYKKTLLDKYIQIKNKDFSFSENNIDLYSGEYFNDIDISNIICVKENEKYYLFTKDFFIEYLYHNKNKEIKNPYTNLNFTNENQIYIKNNIPSKISFNYSEYDIHDKERFINSTINENVYYISNDYFNFQNLFVYKNIYYSLHDLYSKLYFKKYDIKYILKKKIFKFKQKNIDICDNIYNLKNILIDTIFKFIIVFKDHCQEILLYIDYIELLFLIFNRIEENLDEYIF